MRACNINEYVRAACRVDVAKASGTVAGRLEVPLGDGALDYQVRMILVELLCTIKWKEARIVHVYHLRDAIFGGVSRRCATR